MSSDNFDWLTKWYLSQCNSDWEHGYGVRIDTLDNPGWSIKIDLADTRLEGRTFVKVAQGEIAGSLEEWSRTGGWLVAEVKGSMFEAACGPFDLSAVIGIFRAWADSCE